MSQIIVLGWDALDAQLLNRHGLDGRFGCHVKEIETWVDPDTNEPHTKELWPSLITGLHPEDHGIRIQPAEGVEWESSYLNRLSDAAQGIVPKPVLNAIGKRLRDRGHRLDQKRPRYYERNGIETVFNGGGRPISIPNYETSLDRTYGLDATRDDVWAALLEDRDGTMGFTPDISVAGIYDILGSELGKRVGQTLNAINQGHGLVWTWFGLLDTVGHIAPAVDGTIQQDWYQVAATMTETVRQHAPDDVTVICVSDHGLIDGDHTHYATIASDNRDVIENTQSIFDVAPWIDAHKPARTDKTAQMGTDAEMRDVKKQLEGLGYI